MTPRGARAISRLAAVVCAGSGLTWAATALGQVAPPAPESLALGDWHLTPVAEARFYGEYRHDLDGDDRGAIVERVRLGADASRGPIEMRVVLEDARLWDVSTGAPAFGQPGPLAVTGASEGWVEAHTVGVYPSYLRVGRQPITWGEGRLLGAADASPTGRWLDAARGRLVLGAWAFEALGASLSDPVPPAGEVVSPVYAELAGARVEWSLTPLLGVDLYGLARVAQSDPLASLGGTVAGDTYTAALRLHGDADPWAWGAEGALQAGHVSTLGEDRQAWAAAAHVAYTFARVALTPTAQLGASYASGDKGGSKYEGFDPLLPDVHTWYGAMDLFAWSNEEEASARVAVRPWTDGVASVEYRYARLAQAAGAWQSDYLFTVAAAAPGVSTELGHEIDASVRWSPWAPVELAGGYSALVLGDGAKELLAAAHIPAASVAHMGFASITARVP